MKLNNVPFCARRTSAWSGNLMRFAKRRRQNAGLLSQKTGTPGSRTFGNLKPTNDLATTQRRPSKTKPRNPRAPEAIVRRVRASTQQNVPTCPTELRTSNPIEGRRASPGLVSQQMLPADWAASADCLRPGWLSHHKNPEEFASFGGSARVGTRFATSAPFADNRLRLPTMDHARFRLVLRLLRQT